MILPTELKLPLTGKPPRVEVVILNLNRGEDTSRCLHSVLSIQYSDLGVIVVDNASTDGSADTLQRQFPGVVVLRNASNEGFAGGTNRGMEAALRLGADFILLLNNDTVVDDQLVWALLKPFYAEAHVGITVPKIYFATEPARLWYAGGKISKSTGISRHRGWSDLDHGQYDLESDTGYATGCAMLVAREVIAAVGPLDEDFFFTMEDCDYSLRVRAAGYRVRYVPTGRLWHKVASSSGGLLSPLYVYFLSRNRLLLVRKHCGLASVALLPIAALATAAELGALVARYRRWRAFSALFRGLADAFAGRHSQGSMSQFLP